MTHMKLSEEIIFFLLSLRLWEKTQNILKPGKQKCDCDAINGMANNTDDGGAVYWVAGEISQEMSIEGLHAIDSI